MKRFKVNKEMRNFNIGELTLFNYNSKGKSQLGFTELRKTKTLGYHTYVCVCVHVFKMLQVTHVYEPRTNTIKVTGENMEGTSLR
jgi:hypothetical protein